MGQIIGGAAKPKRCNLNKLSQLGIPAAGEYILVSSDNSMNAAGQGNFDSYIEGDGTKAATALELHKFKAEELDLQLNGQSANYTSGYRLNNSDGQLIVSNDSGTSDFVPYTGGDVFWRYITPGQGTSLMCFYDSNKNYISGAYWPGKTGQTERTIPSSEITRYAAGAAYARFCFALSDKDDTLYQNGGTTWTAREQIDGALSKIDELDEEIQSIKDSASDVDIDEVAKSVEDLEVNVIGESKNYVTGNGLNTNGELTSSQFYGVTDFIPYLGGDIVWGYNSIGGCYLCLYDKNKAFINNAHWLASVAGPRTLTENDIKTVTNDAAYIRVSFFLDEMENFYLTNGGNTFTLEEKNNIQIPFSVVNDSYVKRTDGSIEAYSGWSRTNYINIGGCKELDVYTDGSTADNAFFNENLVFIQSVTLGASSVLPNHIIVPDGAKYVMFSMPTARISNLKVTIPSKCSLDKKYSHKLGYNALQIIVDGEIHNLNLIGVRSSNKQASQNLGQYPTVMGYLYLDEITQKIYYSDVVWNKPEYLCDWNRTIADGTCQQYICIITDEFDLVFLNYRNMSGRHNPIIYKHGNYNNPSVIDFGASEKPTGPSDISAFETDCNDGFFMYGEYVNHNATDKGDNVYIWKVEKPYDDPASWHKVLTKWVVGGSHASEHPDDVISHFHTIAYDYFTENWYASTGDGNNRVFISTDGGDTWTEQINGENFRSCGYVFTKDAIYWASDRTGMNHKLWKADRLQDGTFDWNNIKLVTFLSTNGDCTWGVAYVNNPIEGIFMIDKYEGPVKAGIPIGIYLYGLKDGVLYQLDYVSPIDGYEQSSGSTSRYGLPYTIFTKWQPMSGGIVIGANTNYYPCNIQIMNNCIGNYLGSIELNVK